MSDGSAEWVEWWSGGVVEWWREWLGGVCSRDRVRGVRDSEWGALDVRLGALNLA